MKKGDQIDWSKVTIAIKVAPGEQFHFVAHKQTTIKGRTFVMKQIVGRTCFYHEVGSDVEHQCNWTRSVITI